MKINRISKNILTPLTVVLLTAILLYSLASPVHADPVTTPVTCTDGTIAQATRTGTTFTDSDFLAACGSHGYTGRTPTSPTDDSVNPLNGEKSTSFDADKLLAPKTTHICGSDGHAGNATETSENENEVHVAFDFGCIGDAYTKVLNPILDIGFAIFRFLSVGVGLIVIGSIIWAGIQYSSSRGNPKATEEAIKRVSSSIMALIIYVFIFSIANFLVPGGLLIR